MIETYELYDKCENCGGYHPYDEYDFWCPSKAELVEGYIGPFPDPVSK